METPRSTRDGGQALLSQTFGRVASILAAVGAADLLLIKLTARRNGTQPKTREPFTRLQLSMLAIGTSFLQGGVAWKWPTTWKTKWGNATMSWLNQNASLRLEMMIISNRWGTHMPLVDLAPVGFCFFAADLGMSFARRAYALQQAADRLRVLTAMMTPLCAGAIVAGLLAKYGPGKGLRQDDVYRTFRGILQDFQREALGRSLIISEEGIDTIIIQKTVRSLTTAGARVLTFLMQSYNPSGGLPKEVLWMIAGVTQMKFITELEFVHRHLSIVPLLKGVAESLFKAVDIRQAQA